MKPMKKGPVANIARANVRLLRTLGRLKQSDVTDRCREMGWEVHETWLTAVETGRRRIDVDDLVALAVALNVEPQTLLEPIEIDVKSAGLQREADDVESA